ncbi:GTP diphosphokinase [Alteromonas sp. a30]|uniref:GTP diphosphokinase n=1 Tax=Alteromonas sp. a30 TaxID=2730917 RepID=UPI00227DDE43|nr:GTP diphosphokinase [Alteromonas sp. a30]MCY7294292.1 GTP diphosphokinase [Alteromonas sp. a30]
MVSIRKVHQADRPGFAEWLEQLDLPETTKEKLATTSEQPESLLIGQEMVEILHELQMDDRTLQAALIFPYCQIHELDSNQIKEQFGEEICHLIEGVREMDAIRSLYVTQHVRADEAQVDKIRRMLLAMVKDVRAVLIKLAERICRLRQLKNASEESKVIAALECANIYAPLANRLGVGQLKWELEDLAFRYLHPDTYKNIYAMLAEKRSDRQNYINNFVSDLQKQLDKADIQAKVQGRPKHFFSIWRKMQKKNLDFNELFDIRAVRVVAKRVQDCYSCLGLVHSVWKHIPKEFDDYIATPKSNGYQSIHTVVIGPEGKPIEIQIRTEQMHDDAELGVAAHWKYKEGKSGSDEKYEEKIAWLRKILQWHEDMAGDGEMVEELRSQVFEDRVYVYTPKGDVLDLPTGSTPLDFAYYIHSNVGHRCTGAKIAGRIVPLTYELQTGDQVEVLTSKNMNPSRDWMNPSSGYIHSSRARAKIQTWFKKQDREKNLAAGKEMLEVEIQRARLTHEGIDKCVERFNMTSLDDLYVAIGAGDVRIMQVINYLQQQQRPEPQIDPRVPKPSKAKSTGNKEHIIVEGVGRLMSQIARCCQPLPGDPIEGYVTIGRGVSVHKEGCEQLAQLLEQHPERAIEVSWVQDLQEKFQVALDVMCWDRDGILRDLTTVLANEKAGLLGVETASLKDEQTAKIKLKIEVKNLNSLARTMKRIQNIPSVIDVIRANR